MRSYPGKSLRKAPRKAETQRSYLSVKLKWEGHRIFLVFRCLDQAYNRGRVWVILRNEPFE
jgi:hypothetical protein